MAPTSFIERLADALPALLVILLSASAFVWLQILAIRKAEGWLKIAAQAPVTLEAVVVVLTAIGMIRGENTWPFGLLLVTPVIALYLVVVLALALFTNVGRRRAR